jgi:hypothetical protein
MVREVDYVEVLLEGRGILLGGEEMKKYLLKSVSTIDGKVELPDDAIVVSSKTWMTKSDGRYYEVVDIYYLVPDLPGRIALDLCTGRKPECKVGDCATCGDLKTAEEEPHKRDPTLYEMMVEKR